MDFIEVEVVVGLPRAILLQLGGRDVIEVDDGCVGLLADSKDGRREISEFTLDALGIIRLVVVARREGEEDRRSTFGTHLTDETAHVTTKGIDGLLLLGHLIIDGDGIFTHLKFAVWTIGGTGTDRVNGTIVVVSQFKKDVITLAHSFENRFPQQRVEGAW